MIHRPAASAELRSPGARRSSRGLAAGAASRRLPGSDARRSSTTRMPEPSSACWRRRHAASSARGTTTRSDGEGCGFMGSSVSTSRLRTRRARDAAFFAAVDDVPKGHVVTARCPAVVHMSLIVPCGADRCTMRAMTSPAPRSRTLGDLLDEIAQTRADADAVIYAGERLTWAALRARVDALARALLAAGVRPGDRVAVLLPNRPEWLVAAFASARIGAVTVGVSTFSAPPEIAWTIAHCRPAAIVTMESFRGRSYLAPLYAACPELAASTPGALRSETLPELRAVIAIDARRHDGVARLDDFMTRASEAPARALADAQRAVTAADPCFILYTSGSTATPKGVVLHHGSLVDNGFGIGERMRLTGADRVWLAVP